MGSKIWGSGAPRRGTARYALLCTLALGCGDDSVEDDLGGADGLTWGPAGTAGGDQGSGEDGADGADAGDDDDDDDAADDGGSDDGFPGGSDGGADGGEIGEECDGYDNDGDGQVDELCACESGAVQECYAGPPRDAIDCRATTQVCEVTGGSEQTSSWGPCGGLCDGTTLTLDDEAMFRIWGAAASDRFRLAEGGGFGDIDGDGELDFSGASTAGDAAVPDVGAAYGFYGGPCLQRSTFDLSTMPLDGEADADGHGGFVIDNGTSLGNTANATIGDLDGDGAGDILVVDSGSTMAVAYGTPNPPALVEVAAADGVTSVRLTGGGGSAGTSGKGVVADFDGDGYDEAWMPSGNNHPQCPCSPDGLSVWWGAADLAATQPRDAMWAIGIPHVGQASQHNFSVLGGAGDFDNDGFIDIVAGNGAANDTFVVPYRTTIAFGNRERALPPTMVDGDGFDGFRLEGGPGRGPHPNHQHGDFDGDGVDDVLAFGVIPYSTAFELHLVYGGPGMASTYDVAALGEEGLTIASMGGLVDAGLAGGYTMGFGDIDGDGYDDIAVGTRDDVDGGVAIVWGRPGATGLLDVDVDPETTLIQGAPGLGLTGQLAIEDLDGDGLGDLIVGAPFADGPAGEDTGAGLVKFGACLAAQHNEDLVMGQDGADLLVGTNLRDSMTGGRGDDTLDLGGGADVAYGGQGDDTFIVADLGFARIHGGLGEDTLLIDAAGVLDLTTTGRARVQEIEHIVLGDGSQTLRLNEGDVSGLSRSHTHFVLDGDAADTVTLVGPWTPTAVAPAGYVQYEHGALSVAIADPVAVVNSPA